MRLYTPVVLSKTIPDSRLHTGFQTKTVQKPHPLGWHSPIWLILKNYSTQVKLILIILSENGPSSWHNNFLDRLVDSLLYSHSLCRHTTLPPPPPPPPPPPFFVSSHHPPPPPPQYTAAENRTTFLSLCVCTNEQTNHV